AKVVILINYHSLKAERGRGLSEMLQIAYNLFGSEKNLLNSKDSLLIGVTNTPLTIKLEQLQRFITKDNPTLQKLTNQLFTYDPLDRNIQGGWNRQQFLSAIGDLKPVPHHKKIFNTVLTYEDEHKLLHISETLGKKIQKALETQNYSQSALHYQHLASLSIIDHHTIERHHQTQKRHLQDHVHTQINHLNTQAHFENFTKAGTHLQNLHILQQTFPHLKINPQDHQNTIDHAKNQKAQREARYRDYQKQIKAANKKIDQFIKIIEAQKAETQRQLAEQDKKYKQLLKTQTQTNAENLQTLEESLKNLLQERDTRLAEKQKQLQIATNLKDQEATQKLQAEQKKLAEDYAQRLQEARQEKEKVHTENQKLLEAQQKAHQIQQQKLLDRIKELEAQKNQNQNLRQQTLPSIAYGKAIWEKHFGPGSIKEKEPRLPRNIEEILNEPTPFKVEGYEGKVRDTHLLVWIPKKVNGTKLTLNSLERLFGKYDDYESDVKEEFGTKGTTSHWLLVSKNILVTTRSKTYADQKKLIEKYASKGYTLPLALDIAVAVLLHQKEKGEYLLPKEHPLLTSTWCQEALKSELPVAIGSFAGAGLRVSVGVEYDSVYYGVVVARKLGAPRKAWHL
ncbi:hypothetical protein NEPTK9_001115, partial [Candidatus Neptunochlamydia vexilliferae]|nr:hypothetical protein [Candidatus Neptunochlamydia vexilliferae]